MSLLSKVTGVQYKAALIAAAGVGLVASGWVAQGWRMGKKIEAQKADYFQAKARRGDDYANTLAQAARTATTRIEEAQALLNQARVAKAAALAQAALHAPKGPEFACLNTPLPEDYLEIFRK